MPESPETTLQERRKQQKQQRRREKRDRKKLRKQQERQQQQHGTIAPSVISLPPIQPQLYPPPGPKEDRTQQQDMEWQYQLYIHNQQETQQQQDLDQHRQWQEYYRQLQLLYWHRQKAQRFAGLPPFAVPAVPSSVTTVPGLPHGLPIPQSGSATDAVVWPVLTEAEFAKMLHEQEVASQDRVRKCR
jgi:hypothetical protein